MGYSSHVAERPPVSIAGFDILKTLGEGGMGVVYLARQLSLDRLVALKVLLPERTADEVFLRRFRQEAKAVRDLVHENIVRLFDYDLNANRPYLVFEFVENAKTLSLKIYSDPPPLAPALKLADRLCAGLAHIHDLGIIHRDFKPANVLITPEGQPKIIDLGLARPLGDDATRVTVAGQVVGTMAYMAPEQLLGGEVNTRADVYALGLVLYELLARKLVFSGPHAAIGVHERLNRPLPSIKQFNPEAPLALCQTVERCLATDQKVRPSDAAAVQRLLARYVETDKVSAEVMSAARPGEATQKVAVPFAEGSGEAGARPSGADATAAGSPAPGLTSTNGSRGPNGAAAGGAHGAEGAPGANGGRVSTNGRASGRVAGRGSAGRRAAALVACAAFVVAVVAGAVALRGGWRGAGGGGTGTGAGTGTGTGTGDPPGTASPGDAPASDAQQQRERAQRIAARLESGRSALDLAWLTGMAKRQASLIRGHRAPADIAALMRAQMERIGILKDLEAFLPDAVAYFTSPSIPEAERWALRCALADLDVLEAFCDEHEIAWSLVLPASVARCAGPWDSPIEPWKLPLADARTWLTSPFTHEERFGPDLVLTDRWPLPALPEGQRALVWYGTIRWRPGVILDVLVNRRFRRVLRYRRPPAPPPPQVIEAVEWRQSPTVVDHHARFDFLGSNTDERAYLATWVPARFLADATEIRTRVVDLPLTPVANDDPAILGRMISFVGSAGVRSGGSGGGR